MFDIINSVLFIISMATQGGAKVTRGYRKHVSCIFF